MNGDGEQRNGSAIWARCTLYAVPVTCYRLWATLPETRVAAIRQGPEMGKRISRNM